MDVLKDAEFQNWIKACLAIKCVRDAMVPLVEKYCDEQFERNKDKVDKVCGEVYSCNLCDVTELEPYHKTSSKKCEYKRCACKEKDKKPCPQKRACGLIYDKIQEAHTQNDPRWSNTNCKKWSSNAWEQMKCYISSSGYKDKADIKCADVSPLISICLNYIPLRVSFNQNVEDLDKVRLCRNEVFHSSTLNLENDELKRVFSTLTTFLKLPVFADFQTVVIHQLEYIRKLENGEICIGKNEEDDARKYAMDGIRDSLAALSNTCNQHEEAIENKENPITSGQLSILETNIKEDLNTICICWAKNVRAFNRMMNHEYKDVLTHMEQLSQATDLEEMEIAKLDTSFSGIQTKLKTIKDNVLPAIKIAKSRMSYGQESTEKGIETISRKIIELECQVRLLEEEKQELEGYPDADSAQQQPKSPHSQFMVQGDTPEKPRLTQPLNAATSRMGSNPIMSPSMHSPRLHPSDTLLYTRTGQFPLRQAARTHSPIARQIQTGRENIGELVSDRMCIDKLDGKLHEFLRFIERTLLVVQDCQTTLKKPNIDNVKICPICHQLKCDYLSTFEYQQKAFRNEPRVRQQLFQKLKALLEDWGMFYGMLTNPGTHYE